MKTVVIVGALDTKGKEFAYVKELIEKEGSENPGGGFRRDGQARFSAGYHPRRGGRAGRRRPGGACQRAAQG